MASADILRAARAAETWGVIERNEHWLLIQEIDRKRKNSPLRVVTALVPSNHVRAEQIARLICAAPSMLEALKAVVRVADRNTVEFDLARAAIAAAEAEAGR